MIKKIKLITGTIYVYKNSKLVLNDIDGQDKKIVSIKLAPALSLVSEFGSWWTSWGYDRDPD